MFGRNLLGLLKCGPFEYLRQLVVLNEFRGGQLLATDRYGNKYYEINDDPDLLFCTLSPPSPL